MNTNWPDDSDCNTTLGKPYPFAEWWPADPTPKPPWQSGNALPLHVAKTKTVACGPGLLRAADPPAKR
jgi:hypothetical protein